MCANINAAGEAGTKLSLFFCFASSLATWDAIRSSNAPSGGSHGSPRPSICWKPLGETWDAPDCDGNNEKTYCTTAGPTAAGAAASAAAAASYSEPNQEVSIPERKGGEKTEEENLYLVISKSCNIE